MKNINIFSIVLIFLMLPIGIKAQNLENLIDFLTVYPNKKAVERDSTIYPTKLIFTPVVSYAPETNLSFGFGMKGLFKMKGSGSETRTSNIPLTTQYTIENKYLFYSGFAIFFPQERYMLTGNITVQSLPRLYYGVGQNTPYSNEEEFAYNQILIEPIFLKKVFMPYLFVGTGFRYNRISNLEAIQEGLLALSNKAGAHGSTSSGIQLAMIYDSRDNVLNASKGFYIALTHGFYIKKLGGTQNYELTRFDFRYYMQPLKKPSSILAFQIMAHLSHGDTPLLELGRLGGGDIMRGYFEGRYTDRHFLATQVEWRQKLNYRWGLVAFAGLGSVTPSINQIKIDNIHPSVGLGVRFLVDAEENLNLRLDLGIGQQKFKYYFKIAEAF